MHVVFWQNITSPHQAGFMRGLAERGHDVTVVARERMSSGRQRLGWQSPQLEPARVVVAPALNDMKRLVWEGPAEAIHCIAGARVDGVGAFVARECRAAQRRMGIISESPDPRGFYGMLRWGKYAVERTTIGRCYDFVLAMGETGVRWFGNCGYSAARVFPFAYVTECDAATPTGYTKGQLRALFVGQLIHRKGIDVLLRAMARVEAGTLDVVGDGPLRGPLQSLASRLGIAPRVRWLGTLASAEVSPHIAGADVLVLPSRHDGWGAVVNEALMEGTPVICSTACGASDLLRHDWLGTVVPEGDIAALSRALASWSSGGRPTIADRQRIREWAHRITGESLAAYVEDVFRHVYEGAQRPVAPWRSE